MRQAGPCPKCGGSMAPGFVVDTTYGGATASGWHPGAAVKSFWTGLKWSKKSVLPITAWRCERCGFLEHYAQGQG